MQNVQKEVDRLRRRTLMTKGKRITRNQALARMTHQANTDRFAERLHAKLDELRRQGLTTSRELAAALNEAGFRTTRGNPWSADSLRDVRTRHRNQGRAEA